MSAPHTGNLVATFGTFSFNWWQTSGATLAITALMLVFLRYLHPDQRGAFARGVGWLLLLWMILPPVAHLLSGHWHLGYSLPLQWCDYTGGIAGIALLTRRQFAYEVSLFWGITGGGSALLTPQFTQGTEWFYLAEFFISHCILLTAPFFLSIYGNMRPRAWSWLGSLGWLNVAAVVVGAFDLLTDANYMFLLKAPNGDLPLYNFSWPYYLIGFEIACLVMFMLIYLPFKLSGAARPGPLGPAEGAALPWARAER